MNFWFLVDLLLLGNLKVCWGGDYDVLLFNLTFYDFCDYDYGLSDNGLFDESYESLGWSVKRRFRGVLLVFIY